MVFAMVLLFPMVAQADDGTLPEPPTRVLPAVAGAAFENADFEHGDFRNWPVHEGWVVRDIGPNADVTGDFFRLFGRGHVADQVLPQPRH